MVSILLCRIAQSAQIFIMGVYITNIVTKNPTVCQTELFICKGRTPVGMTLLASNFTASIENDDVYLSINRICIALNCCLLCAIAVVVHISECNVVYVEI